MKKKRPKRKSRPPSARARGGEGPRQGPLQYKVVELSTVDESSLESTLNEWAQRGWSVDGIQFAMRESSRRPAMAFVLFTRPGARVQPETVEDHARDAEAARAHLGRLAAEPSDSAGTAVSAYERLVQLAEEGDE
jgi:hypothetical protein